MRQNDKIPATDKKQTYLHFWLYREILDSFQSFRAYISKYGQILEIFEEIDFELSVAKKIPELIGKIPFTKTYSRQ